MTDVGSMNLRRRVMTFPGKSTLLAEGLNFY